MMNLNKFIWLQKEGLFLGLIYGIIAPFAGLGMATLGEVVWWHKLLIFPAWAASWFGLSPSLSFALSIIIGGSLGILVDMLYKPNE